MTQIVGTVYDGSTAASTHNITVPSGVTTGMTALFVIGTGTSAAVTTTLSRSGSTFTKLDEQNAVNTRVAVWTGANLAAGNTVALTLSGSQAVTVAHYYTDDYTFTAGSLSAAVRSASSASTTSGSVTASSGQRVVLVAVERTTTATVVSSVTSSGGETVTDITYGEGTGSAQASCYAGSFAASGAGSRTATITYSNSSGNGYAALILTSGGGGSDPGGGQGPGGSYTTPGQAHNIGKAGGKNHFNLGVGARSGHTDITENAIEGGYVRNPSGGDAAYYLNADKTAVRMEVPLDGGRTSANTAYPRVEYRELNAGGSGDSDTPKASWSGQTGDHYLTGRSRVVKLPPGKPEVVLGQIHGGSDDTAKIKWKGRGSTASVIATYGDDDYATIATGLTLGNEYQWKIQALNGSIRFYWVNMSSPAVTISDAPLVDSATQYFKAGAYAQCNDETDDVADGPVIVELRDLEAWHTGYPPPSTPAGVPTVNAGVDASVAVGSTFARTASEVANGSTITTRTWKIQSGPDGVGSTIDTDANLAWTPTVAGTYVLRYSAINSTGTGFDDVTVTVTSEPTEPPPGGGAVYPLAYPDNTPYPVIGAGSTTVNVSTASALTSALSAATPGQKIVLANGSYSGQFTITGKTGTASNGISIEAATTGGATFASGSTFQVKDCQHVTVKGLSFPYESVGELFQFRGNAKWVRITRCTFGPSGSPVGNTESGNLVFAGDDVSFFRVDHCTFRNKGFRGNAVRVYGNFDKVDAGDGANAGCRYGRIDHNLFLSIKPSVTNDKEPIRYGVSTMSRTTANAVIERNVFVDCLCEPELTSVKMGRIRVSGNSYFRCAGGPVIRHGIDSIMSDNYVIDGVGTSYTETDGDVIGSGGFRFYDSGHDVTYNYCDQLSATGNFQRALLLDTGDAEGSSTALANHWRVVDATVTNNVIVNSTTGIVVGDNYNSAPTGCTVTDNITANISTGTPPITSIGGIQLANSTVARNQHFSTPAAAGLVQDGDGIWRKAGFGPRVTYLKQADVGPAADVNDTDGTGTPISGSGPGGAPVVNAGGSATVLVGAPFTRTATETGSGIITRQWTLESGPGVSTPTTPPSTPPVPPAQVFVSTTGNDSNSGTSAGSPKRTIGAALSVAQAGQIIEVASGTYTGNVVSSKGGSASGGYITIRSAVKHGAVISGNDAGEEAAVVLGHQYLRIQDMAITGTSSSGLRIGVLFKASNLAVVGCKIFNVCRFLTGGTSFQGGGGIDFAISSCSNILIDGNLIFDIGAPGSDEQLVHGMYLSSHVTNGRATNNVIYNVEDFGFHPYDETEASGWQIINNTVVNTGRGILQAPGGTTRNNIVFNTSGRAYDIRGSGNVGSNNIYGGSGTGATGASIGATSANPQFVSLSGNDYRLGVSSPALNAGTSTGAPATDIDGVTRPQGAAVDLGAYETPVGGSGGGGGGGGGGGTPTGTVLSTTATVTWTPSLVGTYGLRYSATNSIGTGTDDITVIASTTGGGGSTSAPPFKALMSGSGESDTISVNVPAGVAAEDGQIAVLLSAGSETITQSPAGWTLWDTAAVTSATGDPGGPMTAWVYTSTTATASAAWTKSGTRKWHAVRLAYSGQGAFGVHLVTAETTAGSSHPTPAVSTVPNARVVGVVCADRVNSITGPFTPPAGWTERYDETITMGTENLSIAVADFGSAGGSVSGSFTSTLTDECAVFAIVLDPTGADQVVLASGIAARRGFGVGSVAVTSPLPAITTAGIPARRALGVGTIVRAAAPQVLGGIGIGPR